MAHQSSLAGQSWSHPFEFFYNLSFSGKSWQNPANKQNKNCPQWGLNSGPHDHHANALPNEPSQHLVASRKYYGTVATIKCSKLNKILQMFLKRFQGKMKKCTCNDVTDLSQQSSYHYNSMIRSERHCCIKIQLRIDRVRHVTTF